MRTITFQKVMINILQSIRPKPILGYSGPMLRRQSQTCGEQGKVLIQAVGDTVGAQMPYTANPKLHPQPQS